MRRPGVARKPGLGRQGDDPDQTGRRCPRGCGLSLVFDELNRRWHCPLCGYSDRPLGHS